MAQAQKKRRLATQEATHTIEQNNTWIQRMAGSLFVAGSLCDSISSKFANPNAYYKPNKSIDDEFNDQKVTSSESSTLNNATNTVHKNTLSKQSIAAQASTAVKATVSRVQKAQLSATAKAVDPNTRSKLPVSYRPTNLCYMDVGSKARNSNDAVIRNVSIDSEHRAVDSISPPTLNLSQKKMMQEKDDRPFNHQTHSQTGDSAIPEGNNTVQHKKSAAPLAPPPAIGLNESPPSLQVDGSLKAQSNITGDKITHTLAGNNELSLSFLQSVETFKKHDPYVPMPALNPTQHKQLKDQLDRLLELQSHINKLVNHNKFLLLYHETRR